MKNPQTRRGLGAVGLLPMGRRRHRLSRVGLGWVYAQEAAEGEGGQSNREGEEEQGFSDGFEVGHMLVRRRHYREQETGCA